ncbi:hypothetical protein ACFL2G_03045 [Candidatus Omnitrophota bacterium]
MNKKLFLVPIFILFSTGHLAHAYPEKISNNLKEYLKTYDITFMINADLNNNGKQEKITLYRQWDGEDPEYSDDQWHVLCIFDDKGNTLYMKDVSYFQEVTSLSVKDNDGDGLKEIIVSLEQAECWDAKTQVYGWREGSYSNYSY